MLLGTLNPELPCRLPTTYKGPTKWSFAIVPLKNMFNRQLWVDPGPSVYKEATGGSGYPQRETKG